MLILSANYISAQIYSAGLKGGLNYSNISGYYPFISSYKTGLAIGGFVDYRFSEHVFIELQAIYEQKGYEYEEQDFANKIRLEGIRYYDYLSWPFFFKYRFGDIVKFNVKLGTYLAMLLNAREEGLEFDYSFSPPNETYKQSSIMHKTASFDMGFSFGFGLERNITKNTYFLFDAMLVPTGRRAVARREVATVPRSSPLGKLTQLNFRGPEQLPGMSKDF